MPKNYTILVKYKHILAGGYCVKKWVGLVLALAMILGFFSSPLPASAAIDESDLDTYLK